MSTEPIDELRARLPELRRLPGCPEGTDEAILAMSNPPGHTACPNPFVDDWLPEATHDTRKDTGPFASDTTAGKTSLVYRAHSYPTKVPHEAIMRLILHYTEPGDIILDGFCGTGSTGVAAQMCGSPSTALRHEIEQEMGDVKWGTRKAFLQDLAPNATFIAAGLNLPVDSIAFDRASTNLLDRFDAEWGWMYETTITEGGRSFIAKVDYTVWSEVFTCPHCGDEVVFYDVAFDPGAGTVDDEFKCGACGALLTKRSLRKRRAKVRTMAGDIVNRTEFRPAAIHWRSERRIGIKTPSESDADILRRVASTTIPPFPTVSLPYMHMTHERTPTSKNGFDRLDIFWSDRALVALSVLWNSIGNEPDKGVRNALKFWIEQAMWGLSWMNRHKPIQHGRVGGSAVNNYMSGVYYIPSLSAECAARYNLEGSRPSTGKRANLVKLWSQLNGSSDGVRISTASAKHIPLPDSSVDYIFVDPPFGENIYYSDLAFLVETWHGVRSAVAEEAIIDRNRQRPKGLPEYAHLMERCFVEFHRVLKPGRWMTVEFNNASNDVWETIQHALARAGFVVADTHVFDKEQHSYRQVTAANAVKRDLIISAYRPAATVEERVTVSAGSEEGVREFLAGHLAHLPVKAGRRTDPHVVRERMADRLYDRMVAYHVSKEIAVPMTTAEFNAALDRWFIVRDGMYFLPAQAEEWERFRLTFKELGQLELFITGESSAVQWLRQLLHDRPRTYAEIQPAFFGEIQKGLVGWDELPDLKVLLEQNFVQGPDGRRSVPDHRIAGDLERLRLVELIKTFESYRDRKGSLMRFRSEAVRAGFKQCWSQRDYATIVQVARRMDPDAFAEDASLLHYFRNAERMVA